MKKEITVSILVYVCLSLLPAQAYSGDQAWFRLIGFSRNGEHVAWETGGIQDGSGFQWITVEVLNTQTSLQEDLFEHVWDEFTDESPELADLSAVGEKKEDLWYSWGIDLDIVCEPLIYHSLTDLGVRRDTVVFCLESYVQDYNSGEITLTLINKPADIEQNCTEWPPVTPILQISGNGEEHILFKEDIIQESWRMSMNYGIYAVYRNPFIPDNLLVVLISIEPGFEGPNGRFRVVSGECQAE
ncbi:MAG: DUF2259 domain-containing protein [Candidatus Aegiribacteria sp.]|nr:DUF2259 domain-containing protein [Candidatus Aegiribacteria sp.]